jgi:hypothetical protein
MILRDRSATLCTIVSQPQAFMALSRYSVFASQHLGAISLAVEICHIDLVTVSTRLCRLDYRLPSFVAKGCFWFERVKRQKHTTGGIPRWSPTLVLVARFSAYVWQSGRDAWISLLTGQERRALHTVLSAGYRSQARQCIDRKPVEQLYCIRLCAQ